jgi:hypothetical protein
VTPRPARDTPAGRAYNDLRNLAKQHDRDVAEYLTLYALERLLARLSASNQTSNFVLKGGTLMAVFAARRPTRDIDLRASGFPNDIAECERRIREIVAIEVDDGLVCNTASVRGELIRDEDDYTGVRVHVEESLAKARMAVHVDINFGDPIWPAPEPTDIPRLLGGTVRLLGYPDHMVLAEKIVTTIQRGIANTRWRDFIDIDSITQLRTITEADLSQAIATVAEHRHATLRPLAEVLVGMAEVAQPKWLAWRRKQRLEAISPAQIQDLLDRCSAFADPVLSGDVEGLTWQPDSAAWS